MGTPRLPRAQRRRLLLDDAIGLFAEIGPAAATTADLARRSKVSEPVLYRHFSSKQALISAVIDEVLARVRGALTKISGPRAAPREALGRICLSYPALSRRLRAESRIIARALAEGVPGPTRRALGKHYRAYEKFLTDLIKEGQRSRTIRADIPAAAAAWHLIHAAVGFQLTQGLEGPSYRKGHERHWARLLMDGLSFR